MVCLIPYDISALGEIVLAEGVRGKLIKIGSISTLSLSVYL